MKTQLEPNIRKKRICIQTSLIWQVQFPYQIFGRLKIFVLIQLKVLSVQSPHIIHIHQPLQILLKHAQLKVFSLVKWQNRNPVIQLKRVRIRSIVHQNHIFEIPFQIPKVFNVQVIW